MSFVSYSLYSEYQEEKQWKERTKKEVEKATEAALQKSKQEITELKTDLLLAQNKIRQLEEKENIKQQKHHGILGRT